MGNPPTLPADPQILLREAISSLNSVFSNSYEERYGPNNHGNDWYMSRGRNYGRGEDPFVYQTIWELWAAQYHSRLLCRYNEFAIGAVENRVNYITGETGFSIEVQPRFPEDTTATDLARRVQEFLDVFSEVNNCAEMQSEAMLRSDEDGEWFVRLFYRRNGMTELRFIEPEHVISKLGDVLTPQYSFGIETDEDDVNNVKAYWITERPYITSIPTRVDETEVVHGKFNSRSSAKRGYPSFLPVGPNLRRCEDLLQSLTQVARTRAKIALIRKLTGVDSTTANRLVQNVTLTRRQRTNSEGTPSNVEDFKDGSILTTGQNSEYEFPNYNLGATDFVDILQAELRAIATRFQMPEWMFTALADAKYNNAFIVESPALKAFSRLQTKQHRLWVTGRVGQKRSIYWRAIVWAVQKGLLPEDVIRRLKLVANGPTLISRDKQQEASINIAYKNAGLKDDTSIQREQGFDPDEVASNKAAEFKEGRMKFDLPTLQAVRGYLEDIATGALDESTGYTFVSGLLGLPVDIVKNSFRVKPNSRQPATASSAVSTGKEDDTEDEPVGESQQKLRESFKEEDHPRDDNGRFVSGADIEVAKTDPTKAEELRSKTTDPEQRAKLDAALGSEGGSTGQKIINIVAGDKSQNTKDIVTYVQDMHTRFPLLQKLPNIEIYTLDSSIDTSKYIGLAKPDLDTIGGYIHRQNKILLSSKLSKNGTSKLGGYTVGSDMYTMARHEYGHHVLDYHREYIGKIIDPETNKQMSWQRDVASKFVGKDKANVVSEYAKENYKELFAESFAIYTDSNYERGSLPKEIEKYLDLLLGGSNSTPLRDVFATGALDESTGKEYDSEDESTQQLRESFKESDHPRDDAGKFTSGEDIEAAKNDPAKAEELRAKTTD